jgi:transcriptional regulator with XRE-family HTH domain
MQLFTQKMKTTLGTFVREKRLDKNIGLNNFAKMVGVSAPFISKMEVGDWNAPSEATIIKIAEILEMDKDYLLALAGKISTENKQKIIDEILQKNI